MFGPDPEQQRRMASEMDATLEQIERETSAFVKRLVVRWAIRWAVAFAIIFALTRMVDWLDWLWWIAVPIAVLTLGVPLLFRRFLMKRLAGMRGQMGGMSGIGGGETIDGSWRDAERPGQDRSPSTADAVIIDQRDPEEDGSGGGRL